MRRFPHRVYPTWRAFRFLLIALSLPLLTQEARAVTHYWTGAAQDQPQIITVAVADTWATNDTASLTLNFKTLTYRVGSATTTSDVAEGMARMINGEAEEDSESWNTTGTAIGEWAELEATSSGATLTLTSRTPGVGDYEITESEVTAGSGNLGTPTTAQGATGKNWVTNVNNWDTLSTFSDGDTLVFGAGDVDCIYGLGVLAEHLNFVRQGPYTGNIGLPKINRSNPALPYFEFRKCHLNLNIDETAKTAVIGDGTGSSSGRTFLESGSDGTLALAVVVNDTASDNSDGTKPVELVGNGLQVRVIKGHVALANEGITSASIDELRVGQAGASEECSVRVAGTFSASAPIEQLSGTVTIDGDTAANNATIQLRGGELTIVSGAHDDPVVYGGQLNYNSDGNLGNVTVHSGGVLNFESDPRSKTVAKIICIRNSTEKPAIYDRFGSCGNPTNGFDLLNCSWDDVDYRGEKKSKNFDPTDL